MPDHDFATRQQMFARHALHGIRVALAVRLLRRHRGRELVTGLLAHELRLEAGLLPVDEPLPDVAELARVLL